MTRKNPMVEDNDEKDLVVGDGPKEWAAGIPGVLHSLVPAIKGMGVGRTRTVLTAMNQKDGFDCMSCAWPDPDHRKAIEFCENGVKAVTWEATPLTVPRSFWAEHSVRPAEPLGVLAGPAGPARRAGLQAGRGRPLPADRLGRGDRHHRRQAQGPRLAGRGGVLHERAHRQRDRVRLPAVRARLRHQQPARLLQHVPRVDRAGDEPEHRHRQEHDQLRRLRQGRPDHHHGPEPGHQPSAHAHRAGGGEGGRRPRSSRSTRCPRPA